MASKRWNVAVTDLAGTAHLHEIMVEADNWMSALRSGRTRIGEEGGVPQGASCAVSPDGVVTILDPVSRRRFVLSQKAVAAIESAPPPEAPASKVEPVAAPVTEQATETPTGKRNKFQTVAFDASTMTAPAQIASPAAPTKQKFQTVAFDASSLAQPQVAQSQGVREQAPPTSLVPTPAAEPNTPQRSVPPNPLAPVAPNTGADSSTKRRKFQTVAFDASSMAMQPPVQASPPATAAAPTAPRQSDTSSVRVSVPAAAPVSVAPNRPVSHAPPVSAPPAASPNMTQVQLLSERSEDPTPKNPLTYRERSFLIAAGTSRANAESALRAELGRLQGELANAKRGKFVNLAVFDHRWQDRPQRPPLATLQWKDWKGDPEVAFPAQPSAPTASVSTAAQDDRLATAFEALQDLPFLSTAAEGLDFAVKLLASTIPSQAIAATLYDINTDELRIVAAIGTASHERKTQAIPVMVGLFGLAARTPDRALVINNAQGHADFDIALDAAAGIEARTMLLRSLIHDGQLFGVMQLINRVEATTYSAEDVALINYVAERVADFVRQVRLRGR